MNDLQPIQEVVIIEIIEKCTPCTISAEKQVSQTIALFTLKLTVDFFLSQIPSFGLNALFSIAFFNVPFRRLGEVEWNLTIQKVGRREGG